MEIVGWIIIGISALATLAIIVGLIGEAVRYYTSGQSKYDEMIKRRYEEEDREWKGEPGVLRMLQRLRRY